MARVLCKELSAPTGIDHCVAARFIAPSERNIIVARSNVLQIYTIRESDEGEYLELVSENRLYGNAQALSAVRVPGRSTHALLLCFADARVSTVRWDASIHSIQVESLHYYENDDKLRDGHTRIVRDPMMTALSSARCACVLAYDEHIIVLPLQKDVEPLKLDAHYTDEELSRRFPSSYTFSLSALGIHRVRDIVLLEGFIAPTLAVLHEDVPAAFNRTAKAPLPCSVTVLSLEHALRKQVVLWKQKYIPYHARKLVSVPPPLGGVLVIGVNGVVYCSSGFAAGLSVNHFGENLTVPYTMVKSAHVHVLDAPQCAWLGPTRLLIGTRSSRLHMLDVMADGVSFNGLRIQRVANTSAPSALCTMDSDLVFVGSRLDDSVLLRVEVKEGKPKKEKEGDSESEGAGKPTADRRYRQEEGLEENKEYRVGGGENAALNDLPDMYDPNGGEEVYNPGDLDAMEVDGASLLARDEEAETDEMVLKDEEGITVPTQEETVRGKVSLEEDNGAARPSKRPRLSEDDAQVELEKDGEESASVSDGAPESSIWSEMKAQATEQDDLLLAELFESSARTASQHKGFIVTVTEIDRLPISGPLVDAVVLPSADAASESHKEQCPLMNPMNDLVCAAGTGESGKLIVFQQSLRPLLHTAFALPDCSSIWSVQHAKPNVSSDYTSYLLLSRPDSTLVLESGESLEEVTESVDFYTTGPTIAAGSVAGGRRIAQVYERGVVLLNGGEKAHEWTIAPEKHFKLVKAVIQDPFILVQTDNRALLVLEAKTVGDDVRVGLCNVNVNDPSSHVTAFTLFQDPSQRELFNQNRRHEGLAHKRKLAALNTSAAIASELERQRQNDAEERDLYEDDGLENRDNAADEGEVLETIPSADLVRPHYAVLALSTGALQVLRLTSNAFTVVFQCPTFTSAPSLLVNDENSLETFHRNDSPVSVDVVELSMISAAAPQSAPFLFARTNEGELIIYESFYAALHSVTSALLPLRFRRVMIDGPFTLHTKPPVRVTNEPDSEPQFAVLSKLAAVPATPTLVPFTNLQSNIRGMFVCGAAPLWCTFNRGRLRFYPHLHEGPVDAFAPFHNQSNPYGFIYNNTSEGKMKICQLPVNVSFESGLISRFVPLGRSVHALAFDAQSRLLAVQTSFPVVDPAHYYQYDLALNAAAEEPKDEETIVGVPLPPRLPALNEERFEVFLMNPENWAILDRYQLKEEEHVMSMKVCHLNVRNEQGKVVQEPFIVLGTAHVRGEDHQVMGNIYIMDVLRPPSDVAASRLDIVASSDQRGAVSSVAPVEGILVACIGMKILFFNFENRKELIGCGFFDCQVQIVNTATIKNYILLADVYKSVYFLRWKEQGKVVELLAKDYDPMIVYSSEFLIDNNSLTMLVSDEAKNVHFLKYDPFDSESIGGQKLLPSGDFHLGAHINRFLRLRLNLLRTHRHPPVQKYGSLYVTLDGGVGMLMPISEHVFNIIGKLEMRMVSTLEHLAGLNPKAFRLSKSWLRMTHNRTRNVVDSQLLRRFPFLERSQQTALAEAVGVSVDDVMDFLMEMDALSAIF